MGLFGTLCEDILANCLWVEDSIHSIKLRLVAIEAQGVTQFQVWKDHVWVAVGQVNMEDISVKTLQQELIELNN